VKKSAELANQHIVQLPHPLASLTLLLLSFRLSPFQVTLVGEETAEPTVSEPIIVSGPITVRYNHYKEELAVSHEEGGTGRVSSAQVVELLSLDYAFSGDFTIHLNKMQSVPRMKRLWQDKTGGQIPGVEVGGEYWVDVQEDDEAEAAVVRTPYNPDKVEEAAPREEGCSCLFGNPCMDSYTCENWAGRFDVAKANGWKGYS